METLNNMIKDFSEDNLKHFFRENVSTFKPIEEGYDYLFEGKEDITSNYKDIQKIGEAEIVNADELLVITAKTIVPLTNKTGKKRQYEIAKKILKEANKDASFFIFYDENGNFRFSFIRTNFFGPRRDFTDFKRYTYFVSPAQTNNTFIRQISSCDFNDIDSILEAFSVEPLNKDFYRRIQESFYNLIGGTVGSGSSKKKYKAVLQLPGYDVKENRKKYQEFAVRLIGRTVFVWFLKNKTSQNGLPLIPKEWLTSEMVRNTKDYYHSLLEKLFFEILNRKKDDRIEGLPEGHEIVPFLNGGLFENQDDDFYEPGFGGYSTYYAGLVIPDKWMVDFFETLEQFNFTIDENTINDQEVSIDPEILGTIFENLLAEIDPATEKSARKKTGSFYTPREIVDYMIEESLVSYLKTKTDIEDEKLYRLFKENDLSTNSFEKKEEIIKAFKDIKILDPACGSGAFPLGAVHKINMALQKLDPDAEIWKEMQLASIDNVLSRKDLKNKFSKSNVDYIRKFGIIQNSIYGVDIQPIATEISKLRCFLSLVVDENINDDDENRGIFSLPNLEFKFVTANTLIGLEEEKVGESVAMDLGGTKDDIEKLAKIRDDYLQAYGDDKEKIRHKYINLRDQIALKVIDSSSFANDKKAHQIIDWNPFTNDKSDWFDPRWMFGVDKFDIVIGNPPYGFRSVLTKDEKKYFRLVEGIEFSSGDAAELFCKKVFDSLVLEDSLLSFIIPKKSTYGESWNSWRTDYLNHYNLIFILDAGKAFENVLLEQTAFCLYKKRQIQNVKLSFLDNNKKLIHTFSKSDKNRIFKNNNTIQIYLEYYPQTLLEKIEDNTNDNLVITGNLGLPIGTDFYSEEETTYKLLKGIDIERWKIKNHRYLRNRHKLDWSNAKKFLKPKVICQRLVAHIQNPFPHIKITACYDFEGIIITNTLTSFKICSSISERFWLGYLNSSFVNWYAYNFIYNRAIRGMDFYSFYIEQIPLPTIDMNKQKDIEVLVDKIIQKKGSDFDPKYEERQIDLIIYKLYNLNYEEVKIIDPDFDLSEEEYKKETPLIHE